jgi:regulator of protease activity HflC (stomatin/prohibitin superfamily)
MHIFQVEWVLSFKVADAAQYYLAFYDDTDTLLAEPGTKQQGHKRKERLRGHEIIIRNLLADAVLTETANWTTEELIKASRVVKANGADQEQRIENCVRSRLEEFIKEIKLGIEVQTVTLVGMYQPPAAALQAFNQVNASERNKQIAIQNAQAFANSLLSQARAAGERIVGEANAYQETIVHRLKADAEYFTAIQKEYAKNPSSTATVLYTEAIGKLLASVPNKYVLHQLPENLKQELRLQISQVPEKRREAVPPAMDPAAAGASAQPGAPQGAMQ